jgi:hypothetical protein
MTRFIQTISAHTMKTLRKLPYLMLITLAGFSLPQARAQLPFIEKQPWLGYFAAYEGRRFTVGITAHGEIKLTPLNDKGEPFGPNMNFPFLIGIEEVPAGGKIEMKVIKQETLKSVQLPTDKLERVVIQGQVSADAVFEAVIEQKGGTISIGGRVLNQGQFKKNPIRFAVRARIPNIYPWTADTAWKNDTTKTEAFLKKAAGDRLEMTRTDGKRITRTFEKPVDAASEEVTGPGIARMEIRMHGLANRQFLFNSSENSVMSLTNQPTAPLYEGFTIHWTPDLDKDKDGTARFSFLVK